ncbi:DUF3150 domain-containing protein [Succinivibrio dextrinosolvens]|uniref:DUF3150 domain-containing protein n=1 Tax=Succinivibrio dextrinosolvens TaxID=83771 RepID=UPI00241F0101|nr:DUF3150 domain-containing protein [Succinivibrio dextrinosolvens]MBE6422901.1 hypothetical protein [Succinivibrio dextrinosolvens]
MENTTVNTSVNTQVNESVMEAFKDLQARSQSQEIVIFEMPIMESQTILPSSDMSAYLSEDFSNEKEIETRFSGEIFSSQKLKDLSRIQRQSVDTLRRYGVLIGKSGVYQTATKDHDAIADFLNRQISSYNDRVYQMLQNYDKLVAEQKKKINEEVISDAAKKTLLSRIPSRQDILNKHQANFRFFKASAPKEEDIARCSSEIMAAARQEELKDQRAIRKIADLFKDFLNINVQEPMKKTHCTFFSQCARAFAFELSNLMILAGSKYESIVKTQYEILHEAEKVIAPLLRDRKLRENNQLKFLKKFKQIAYVICSFQQIEAYQQGQIDLFEGFAQSLDQIVSAPVKAVDTESAEVTDAVKTTATETETLTELPQNEIKAESLDTFNLDEFVKGEDGKESAAQEVTAETAETVQKPQETAANEIIHEVNESVVPKTANDVGQKAVKEDVAEVVSESAAPVQSESKSLDEVLKEITVSTPPQVKGDTFSVGGLEFSF